LNKPDHITKEMEIPSAVMGHVIGPKGSSVAGMRQATGVHVQVISNPTMPFGKLQVGPGPTESVDQCIELVNNKLLEYVAKGQGQQQATGIPANIPACLVDVRLLFKCQKPSFPRESRKWIKSIGSIYSVKHIFSWSLEPSRESGASIGIRNTSLSKYPWLLR
jgi:hypothetical protein